MHCCHPVPETPAGSLRTAGNLLGLLLSPLILINFGWRALFYTFGLCGIPLLLLWMAVVPGKEVPGILQQQEASLKTTSATPPPPASASAASAAAAVGESVVAGNQEASKDVSASSGADVTIGQLLSSRATWAIILVNIVNHWGYFIYLNWMPTYFNQVNRTLVVVWRFRCKHDSLSGSPGAMMFRFCGISGSLAS